MNFLKDAASSLLKSNARSCDDSIHKLCEFGFAHTFAKSVVWFDSVMGGDPWWPIYHEAFRQNIGVARDASVASHSKILPILAIVKQLSLLLKANTLSSQAGRILEHGRLWNS